MEQYQTRQQASQTVGQMGRNRVVMDDDSRVNLDGKQKGANAELEFNSPGLDAAWAKAGYCLEKRAR